MTIFGVNLSMLLLNVPVNFTWGLSVGKGKVEHSPDEEHGEECGEEE